MTNHTAPELLEAVGFDWHKDYALVQCPQCKNHRYYCVTGNQWHRFDCSRPDTSQIAPTYTGPALGTPELDGILLVAGQRWCVENWDKYDDVNDALYDGNLQAINETDTAVLEWLLFYCDLPGHALARAIREVGKA